MSSNRSYRKAHDFAFCYKEIEKNAGTMYDPIITEHVLKHWDEVIHSMKNKFFSSSTY